MLLPTFFLVKQEAKKQRKTIKVARNSFSFFSLSDAIDRRVPDPPAVASKFILILWFRAFENLKLPRRDKERDKILMEEFLERFLRLFPL